MERFEQKQVTELSFWISGNLTSERSCVFYDFLPSTFRSVLSALVHIILCGDSRGALTRSVDCFRCPGPDLMRRALVLERRERQVPCTSDQVKTSQRPVVGTAAVSQQKKKKIHIWLGHSTVLGVYMFSM